MRKFMLMFTCSLIATGSAEAFSAADQLKAVQGVFEADFLKMDANSDGVISKDEFMSYQFAALKSSLAGDEGKSEALGASEKSGKALSESKEKAESEPDIEQTEKAQPVRPNDAGKAIGEVGKTLQELADYDVDLDLDLEDEAPTVKKLTKADVMPVLDSEEETGEEEVLDEDPFASLPPLDFDLAEEDAAAINAALKASEEAEAELAKGAEAVSQAAEDAAKSGADAALKSAVKNGVDAAKDASGEISAEVKKAGEEIVEKAVTGISAEKVAAAGDDLDQQMKLFTDAVKKALPKKIDAVTTWEDASYANREISYVYRVDMDATTLSDAFKQSLEQEACSKAYKEMCGTVKTMLLDKGVTLSIRYSDKLDNELCRCTFVETTCK